MAERRNFLKFFNRWFYNDVARVVRDYPKVNFRYIVSPSEELPSSLVPIFATKEELKFQVDLGETDTIEAMKKYKESKG